MANKDDDRVYGQLRAILKPYASKLVTVTDSDFLYYLDTAHIMKNKKPLFFGAVRRGRAYISYYLMPMVLYSDLARNVSPNLKKRMQGKSCFNFSGVDDKLFKELARLTKASFARYKADKYV
jgi:hypothetical protein